MNTEQTPWWPSRIGSGLGAGWTLFGKGSTTSVGPCSQWTLSQVLRDGRTQEPERLSCDYNVVHDGAGRFLLKLLHTFTTLFCEREDWLTTFCFHQNQNDPDSPVRGQRICDYVSVSGRQRQWAVTLSTVHIQGRGDGNQVKNLCQRFCVQFCILSKRIVFPHGVLLQKVLLGLV